MGQLNKDFMEVVTPEASGNATGRSHPQWVYSLRGSVAEAAQLEIPRGLISKDKPLSHEHAAELVACIWEVAQCWKRTPECWCPELSPTTGLPLCPVISSGSFNAGRLP